ncbi:MAG: HD domain-containing protein [Xanthobacteraceae bacterium]|nr:HD domain-containing protein [Xanthobacteraceae bacterium]
MAVHLVADSPSKVSRLRAMLRTRYEVHAALLKDGLAGAEEIDTAVIAADLRLEENIAALKRLLPAMKSARRRIFLVDRQAHRSLVQAYALGATCVLPGRTGEQDLLAQLADLQQTGAEVAEAPVDARTAAAAGATALAAMFSSALTGDPVDVAATDAAAGGIADSIAGEGLSVWLDTVRRHHESTYQHCLLVTGIAVDFGLSLGMTRPDIERLYSAAMFHDIGKAHIPLAVLDKPGKLDDHERALIETHPAAGWRILRDTAGISPEVLDAVRHHHEYLDGSGYPDALCAENITDVVRILTISDVFAALVERRSYRPPLPRGEAYDIISGMCGKLERSLVRAFRDVALKR